MRRRKFDFFTKGNAMMSFSKADDKFVACATNDAQRQVAIIQRSQQRRVQILALVLSGMVALISIGVVVFDRPTRAHDVASESLALFVVVMQFLCLMKTESDLRLLKVIDLLRQQEAAKNPQAQVDTMPNASDSAEGSSAPVELAP